jgi:hypothetical protein
MLYDDVLRKMKAVVRRAEANEGHRQQRCRKWVKIDGFDPLLVPSDLPPTTGHLQHPSACLKGAKPGRRRSVDNR